tara:strand:+ start:1941 stop:2162 length:222 start_codon:yes stop_codon:yes gene_type:complete
MAKGFELKDNSMSLLKNGYKEDGDNRPDYTGDAKIGGVNMKASLWINKTKDGKTNLRGSFQPKEESAGSDSPF